MSPATLSLPLRRWRTLTNAEVWAVALAFFLLARLAPTADGSAAAITIDVLVLLGIIMAESDPGFGLIAVGIAFGLWFSFPGLQPSPMLWVCGLLIYVWAKRARRFTILLAVALFLASLSLTIDRDARLGRLTVTELVFNAAICALVVAVPWGVGTLAYTYTRQVASARRDRDEALRDLRRNLAAELHDTVAQSQALVVMEAEDALALPDVPPSVQVELHNIIASAQQSVRDLRSMLALLTNSDASTLQIGIPLGLADTITKHVTTLNRAGFSAVASIPDDLATVPRSIELTAAQITRELASNVRWHGMPGPCSFTIAHTPDALTIDITNQISTHRRKQSGGFGLTSVQERARVHHGRVEVDASAPGMWTVHVYLPIHSG